MTSRSTLLRDELIDDSKNETPAVGLVGTLSLQDRFKTRFSRFLGREIDVCETDDARSVDIYIGPLRGGTVAYDGRVREVAEDLQSAMRGVARSRDEAERNAALDNQWDVILLYATHDIHNLALRLQQAFNKHESRFSEAVVRTCGLDEVHCDGTLDKDLGDWIITLRGLASGYTEILMQQNLLVESAWKMIQHCSALDVRLRLLLGSSFATKLYDLVCKLSYPRTTHHTLVRVATTFPSFRVVRLHLSSPASPNATILPRQGIPAVQQQQQPLQQDVPAHNTTTAQTNKPLTIQHFLPEKDLNLTFHHLQPAQRATAILIGSALHNTLLPTSTPAYYHFGFTTCPTTQAEHNLLTHYQHLITHSPCPRKLFTRLVNALTHGTLSPLLFQSLPSPPKSPALHIFLSTPPHNRPSLHRLIQFLRSPDSEDPPPVLCRDYGFGGCTQREHVALLRGVYAAVLDRVGCEVWGLHEACVSGGLREYVGRVLGGHVDGRVGRLLGNEGAVGGGGYDDAVGLERFEGPLFGGR